ncbi:MAG: hypothetical protein Q9169_007571 [Polycauliona sp. 2 TL-2023]
MSHSHDSLGEDPLNLAVLIPKNMAAAANFESMADTISTQPAKFQHHSRFLYFSKAGPKPPVDPTTVETNPLSDHLTSEGSSVDQPGPIPKACYLLSLADDRRPSNFQRGWVAGHGKFDENPNTGKVDLLIESTKGIYSQHFAIRFDEFGRLCLEARHSNVKVKGKPLNRGESCLLPNHVYIEVGRLSYLFSYCTRSPELEPVFQEKKSELIQLFDIAQEAPHELTSATPSHYDAQIGDWIIHGIAATTLRTVVEGASNINTKQAVAVKRMLRTNTQSAERVEREILIYRRLAGILYHKHAKFVMRLHNVLYPTNEQWSGSADEVYMLWTPLARADFSCFSAGGGTQSHAAEKIKLELFYQSCLGLQAVHAGDWIHCDIKPANLYVQNFSPPRAVVGDFDRATQCAPSSGLLAEPGTQGTIGWLAPELENPRFAPTYNQAIDVWSMGAVGAFLFFGKEKMPWSGRAHNIFRDVRDIRNDMPVLHCEDSLRELERQGGPIGFLLKNMLVLEPRGRIPLEMVVEAGVFEDFPDVYKD